MPMKSKRIYFQGIRHQQREAEEACEGQGQGTGRDCASLAEWYRAEMNMAEQDAGAAAAASDNNDSVVV